MKVLMWLLTSFSKHFITTGVKCNQLEVVEAGFGEFLGSGDNSGGGAGFCLSSCCGWKPIIFSLCPFRLCSHCKTSLMSFQISTSLSTTFVSVTWPFRPPKVEQRHATILWRGYRGGQTWLCEHSFSFRLTPSLSSFWFWNSLRTIKAIQLEILHKHINFNKNTFSIILYIKGHLHIFIIMLK